MSRRINLIGVCAISGICILLLFASHRFSSPTYSTEFYRARGQLGAGGGIGGNDGTKIRSRNFYLRSHNRLYNTKQYSMLSVPQPSVQNENVTISDVINSQRDRIAEEMMFFNYPSGEYGNKASKLSDLTLETGGTPIRSLIITTWRSGSTFLGEIINTMPGNYYHYEPLLNFDIIQIRGEPYAKPAVRNLKKLLKCDYTDMEDYLEYGKTHTYLFKHNTRLWKLCLFYPNFCWNPNFLERYCSLFPLQSMKVVRLRVGIAAQLLYDESLNVRMVLLIRDPRGTLQSRKHRDWCPGRPDCDHPPTLCRDMVSDYYAAEILLKKYKDRFMVIRYEDLSLDPHNKAHEVLKFYGLPFDPQVEEFLNSHTKIDIGGVSSTYRDSKSAPFHWMKDLPFEEIDSIQNVCTKAMELWGYRKVTNETILSKTFDPLLPYSFS